MQHLHPTTSGSHTGAAAKLLGERCIRPHNHHNHHHHHHHHQVALKCPRCESINTKFCYYNNYNLSQPRHFCKNCRRYWTKGGVLRNVPVGGGCRRSSKKRTSSSSSSTTLSNNNNNNKVTQFNKSTGIDNINVNNTNNNSSNSSDHESSTTVNVGPTSTPGGGAVYEDHHLNNNLELLFCSGFEPLMGVSSTAENNSPLIINECDMQNQGGGVIDPTVRIDGLLQNRGSNGGLATLDWHDHQGLFDIPSNTLDHHQGFWGQMTSSHHNHFDNINNNNQWYDDNNNCNNSNSNANVTNNDHTLFLP